MAVVASHALLVISLSSADVYSPYVGDEVRNTFGLARQAASSFWTRGTRLSAPAAGACVGG